MTGSDFNFGPDWIWKVLLVLCVLGALTAVAAIIAGVVWLITHVRFS